LSRGGSLFTLADDSRNTTLGRATRSASCASPTVPVASTFEQLASLRNDQLEAVLKAGTPPTAADLTGYEFRGWNQNSGTDIIGTRKFIKGFYGVMPDGTGWGYNMPVEQTGMNQPWKPKQQNGKDIRYGFFRLLPGTRMKDSVYPAMLVVDYRQWPDYFVLSPIKYTVDYLAFVDPGNPNLILGKSYSQFLGLRMFLGFFLLDRLRQSGYEGPAK
jgi:hypothetical protein